MSSVGHQILLILQTSSHRIDNRRQSYSNKRRASLKGHTGKKKERKKKANVENAKHEGNKKRHQLRANPATSSRKKDIKYKKRCSKITRAKRRMGRINCSRDAAKAPRLVPEEPQAGNDEISIATRLASRWGRE